MSLGYFNGGISIVNVVEIKNGVQVNREFDKVKVQGFFQTTEMLENVL